MRSIYYYTVIGLETTDIFQSEIVNKNFVENALEAEPGAASFCT